MLHRRRCVYANFAAPLPRGYAECEGAAREYSGNTSRLIGSPRVDDARSRTSAARLLVEGDSGRLDASGARVTDA